MYFDCYNILASLRYSLNEYSAAFMSGSDVSGRFLNDYLVRKINEAYREIFALLAVRIPQHFTDDATISVVSSVGSLPSNCGAIVQLRDTNNFPIYPVGWRNKAFGGHAGVDYEYIRKARTIVINRTNTNTTLTIYFRKKCRDLVTGLAASGSGAAAIKLPTTARKDADFYNGMEIHNITKDWTDTIDDYAATRVATISETAAENDVFGLFPEIPETFHHLIAKRAGIMVRAEHPFAQVGNSGETYAGYKEEIAALLSAYSDEHDDMPPESIFEDGDDY